MSYLNQLNWVDISLIAIIAISAVISLIRGFVREALSLVTWILAVWVAIRFYQPLSTYFVGLTSNTTVQSGGAFVVLLITTLIIGAIVNYLISQLVRKTGLSGTDRFIGVLFGVGRGFLFAAFMLLMVSLTGYIQTPAWKTSLLIPHFKPTMIWLKEFLPETMKPSLNTTPALITSQVTKETQKKETQVKNEAQVKQVKKDKQAKKKMQVVEKTQLKKETQSKQRS